MRSTKIIKICSSSLCTCLHHMVILRTRNKITDFLMILAWASPFKASFYIPENRLNFPITKGFRTKIPMKLVYQYMAILFNFPPTSSHLHPLQVENCNSRLVVDEDDNGKLRLERVNYDSVIVYRQAVL